MILILLFVSKTGHEGYLWLLVISNTFTYALCRYRLYKVTGVKPRLYTDVLLPMAGAVLGGMACRFVVSKLAFSNMTASCIAGTSVYLGVFMLIVVIFAFERFKVLFYRLRGNHG